MCKYYLIKEEGARNNTFAIILERTRSHDTKEAMRIAINEKFGCYCKPGVIDLEKVEYGKSQILHVAAGPPYKGDVNINIEVSTIHLY